MTEDNTTLSIRITPNMTEQFLKGKQAGST